MVVVLQTVWLTRAAGWRPGSPFSPSMMPTGFLCLCSSSSAFRQVRKRQTEAKRNEVKVPSV